ncbi:MAG: hypothetical protein WBL85_01590 [Sedimentisphaerales bacterium]
MSIIIKSLDMSDASQVARLHISGIATGFISLLGQEFVTALYEAIAESIADGVRKFLKMSQQELDTMGENGRKFYRQELSLAVRRKRLAEVLESAIRRSRGDHK